MPCGVCHAGLTEDKALTTTTTIIYNDLLDLEAALTSAFQLSTISKPVRIVQTIVNRARKAQRGQPRPSPGS